MASSLYNNPFYQGITNLGSILTPDPQSAVAAQKDAQQILTGRAQMNKLNEETADITGYRTGRTGLSDAFRNGASPEEIYAASVLAGSDYYGNTPKVYTGYYGAGDNVDQQRLSNMVVSTGGNFGNTQLGFGMDQARLTAQAAADDATRRYGYDKTYDANIYGTDVQARTSVQNNELDNLTQRYGYDTQATTATNNNILDNETQRYGYDQSYKSSIENNNLDNETARLVAKQQVQAELEKSGATPQVVMQNGVPTIVRRDNSYGGVSPISETDARGSILSQIVQDPSKAMTLGEILRLGRDGAQGKPNEFTPQEAEAMMSMLPQLLPGGAEIVAEMPPEFRNQILGEVAAEYQRTGDFATAVSSVVQRIQPGQEGWFSDTPWQMAPGAAPAPAATGTSVPPPPPGFRVIQ